MSTFQNCLICKVLMTGETPETVDCGGDCAECMFEAGDPDITLTNIPRV